MDSSLWGNISDIDSTLHTTANISNILRTQSISLKEQTNDVIKGRFKPIKIITVSTNPYKNMVDSIASISEALKPYKIEKREVLDEFENENLADANALYCKLRYGYEIYTSRYKFRIFELTLDPVYPILVNVDEGIIDDCICDLSLYFQLSETNAIEINSDEEFIELLSIILKSKKLRFIINNLIQKT